MKLNFSDGFSLIEMAAVVTISGILVASAAGTYNIYRKDRNVRDTYEHFQKFNKNMESFFKAQGRYPCPSDPLKPEDGTESCIAATIGNITGAVRVAGGAYADSVYIGAIPYKTLRLGIEDINPDDGVLVSEKSVALNEVINRKKALDGWGRQMTYIVTAALTSKASFKPNLGAIAVTTETASPISLVTPSGSAAWVVMSHGYDGAGSYTEDGGLLARACQGYDSFNCTAIGIPTGIPTTLVTPVTLDMTIKAGLRNLLVGTPNHYYDDMVYFASTKVLGFWEPARNDPITLSNKNSSGSIADRDITNTNIGFVGLGTKTPTERLDVVGDVKSNEIHATKICNKDGTKCFIPSRFGSNSSSPIPAGTLCATGKLMTGIGTGGVIICTPSVVASAPAIITPSACPAGQYALGVTSVSPATLICGDP